MIKETIKYTDWFGNEREEDYYFNLMQSELVEMEMNLGGSLEYYIQKISQTQDMAELWKLFKNIVLKAYGEKSTDGKRFMKSEEMRTNFEQTPAYDKLIMKLIGDAEYAGEFVNQLMPRELVEAAAQVQNRPALTTLN